MARLRDRLSHAWDVFRSPEIRKPPAQVLPSTYRRPDTLFHGYGSARGLIEVLYHRIALDVSMTDIKHCTVDKNGTFAAEVMDPLNERLRVEANEDQTGRELIYDIVYTMLQDGVAAVVPVDTDVDITKANTWRIDSVRVGVVRDWMPGFVRVQLYNPEAGRREDVVLPKRSVALVQNPFFQVANQPNVTLKRLTERLETMDVISTASRHGKLDLILQLPYAIKNTARAEQAKARVENIRKQLEGSTYGISYVDATEHITQLNRPVENTIMGQVEWLTDQLYKQLSISPSILDGSADEQVQQNYYQRTVRPILEAIVNELTRKFLTKTARSIGHRVMYFHDPFMGVTLDKINDIADTMSRNAILTPNEIRGLLGFRPADDPNADKLVNPNINPLEDQSTEPQNGEETYEA